MSAQHEGHHQGVEPQRDESGGDNRTEEAKRTNPPRSDERPEQTAEVPLGTGSRPEPPGGGGRPAQQRESADKPRKSSEPSRRV